MIKLFKYVAFAGVSLLAAKPALAAEVVAACSPSDVSPVALSCGAGWYAGNLLNAAHIKDQVDALATLGLNWDGNWAPVDLTKVNASGSVFDFGGVLNGDTWLGIYKGKGGREGFQGTGFFFLKADNLGSVSLNLNGASSAVVYKTAAAVPEPATWAMLLIGFGSIGLALRRRRRDYDYSCSAPSPKPVLSRHIGLSSR